MFKLRTGYLLSGIATGLVILFGFIGTLPDGKLHIVFCDVGQGDAAYIRFPDGRDMVVDGGPNDTILGCLGEHMPFWDRQLDIVLLTHPQKDHMQGLLSVFDRYDVGYFIRSDITNSTEGYQKLLELIKKHGIKEKFVTSGERISIGQITLNVLWPSIEQTARMGSSNQLTAGQLSNTILGAQNRGTVDLNDGSIVFHLEYGNFDAVFTGDADTRVEGEYRGTPLGADPIEVLKVPHHGSKTGMTEAYLDWLFPLNSRPGPASPAGGLERGRLAVISVGKNSYGHPNEEIIKKLVAGGTQVKRTDQEGDVLVVSDGKNWEVLGDYGKGNR